MAIRRTDEPPVRHLPVPPPWAAQGDMAQRLDPAAIEQGRGSVAPMYEMPTRFYEGGYNYGAPQVVAENISGSEGSDTLAGGAKITNNLRGSRTKPVSPALTDAVSRVIEQTYGPGYYAVMRSAAGSSITGTKRHTPGRAGQSGVAGDFQIFAPDGHQLAGAELDPLLKNWVGIEGSAGANRYPGNKGSNFTHLDLIGGIQPYSVPLGRKEDVFWTYGGLDPNSTFNEWDQKQMVASGEIQPAVAPQSAPSALASLQAPEGGTEVISPPNPLSGFATSIENAGFGTPGQQAITEMLQPPTQLPPQWDPATGFPEQPRRPGPGGALGVDLGMEPAGMPVPPSRAGTFDWLGGGAPDAGLVPTPGISPLRPAMGGPGDRRPQPPIPQARPWQGPMPQGRPGNFDWTGGGAPGAPPDPRMRPSAPQSPVEAFSAPAGPLDLIPYSTQPRATPAPPIPGPDRSILAGGNFGTPETAMSLERTFSSPSPLAGIDERMDRSFSEAQSRGLARELGFNRRQMEGFTPPPRSFDIATGPSPPMPAPFAEARMKDDVFSPSSGPYFSNADPGPTFTPPSDLPGRFEDAFAPGSTFTPPPSSAPAAMAGIEDVFGPTPAPAAVSNLAIPYDQVPGYAPPATARPMPSYPTRAGDTILDKAGQPIWNIGSVTNPTTGKSGLLQQKVDGSHTELLNRPWLEKGLELGSFQLERAAPMPQGREGDLLAEAYGLPRSPPPPPPISTADFGGRFDPAPPPISRDDFNERWGPTQPTAATGEDIILPGTVPGAGSILPEDEPLIPSPSPIDIAIGDAGLGTPRQLRRTDPNRPGFLQRAAAQVFSPLFGPGGGGFIGPNGFFSNAGSFSPSGAGGTSAFNQQPGGAMGTTNWRHGSVTGNPNMQGTMWNRSGDNGSVGYVTDPFTGSMIYSGSPNRF